MTLMATLPAVLRKMPTPRMTLMELMERMGRLSGRILMPCGPSGCVIATLDAKAATRGIRSQVILE